LRVQRSAPHFCNTCIIDVSDAGRIASIQNVDGFEDTFTCRSFMLATSLGSRLHPRLPPPSSQLNGKKLVPNNSVISKFMLPLTVWAVAVIVVFGVTFQRLAGLQAPLASLNAAARVTYLISRVRVTVRATAGGWGEGASQGGNQAIAAQIQPP
jgi:hypothetical protein